MSEEDDSAEAQAAADTKLWPLLSSMSIGEWSVLAGALVAVVGGSAAIGNGLERIHRSQLVDDAVNPIKRDLTEARTQFETIREENRRLIIANKAMEAQTLSLIEEVQQHRSFATFAEAYINYLAGGGETAAAILADYVCSLYRESQESGRDVEFTPLSIEEVVLGDFELNLTQLATTGFNVDLLVELRDIARNGVQRHYPNVSRRIGRSIQPSAQPQSLFDNSVSNPREIISRASKSVDAEMGRMIKVVTFPGHTPFTLPGEIAARVHDDRDCRVR